MKSSKSHSRTGGKAFFRNLPILLAICMTGLQGLGAGPAPNRDDSGYATDSSILISRLDWHGIEVVAVAQWWEFKPHELDSEVIPILLNIVNKSDQPIDISISDFTILDSKGRTRKPLLPENLRKRFGASSPLGAGTARVAADAVPAESELLCLAARQGRLLAESSTKKLRLLKTKPIQRRPAIRLRPMRKVQPRSPGFRSPSYGPAPGVRHYKESPPAVNKTLEYPGVNRSGAAPGIMTPVTTPGIQRRTRGFVPSGSNGLRRPLLEMQENRRIRYRELVPGQGSGRASRHRDWSDRPCRRRRHGHCRHAYVYIGVPLGWWGCHPYWGCFGPYPWPYLVYNEYYVQTAQASASGGEPESDIETLALGEGILDPGRKVSGFLFFDRAGVKPPYSLQWEVWGEQGDLPLSTVSLVFGPMKNRH